MLKGQIGDVAETLAPVESWTDGIRVFYKFKPTNSGQLPRIYHDGQAGDWELQDIQIETGSVPTGYDYVDIESELNNPANYNWQKTVGQKGEAGTPGVDGKTPYIHTAYANKDAEGNYVNFSFTDNQRDYKGMYTDYLESSSNDPKKYIWEISAWKLERDKADQIDFNNVLEIIKTEAQKLQAISTEMEITKNNALITHTDEIMTTITKLVGNAENVDQQVKIVEQVINQVSTYFQFADNLTIGKSDSKIKIEIDNQKMEFKDGETVMAWLSGNIFNAQSIIVKQGISWPSHEIKSEGDLLVCRYIGG